MNSDYTPPKLSMENFPSWEKEFLKQQAEKQTNKNQMLTISLYQKFQINFSKLKSLEELTGFSTDDGCEHYIDLKTRDVYSWDFIENEWHELNEDSDVLALLDEPFDKYHNK